jgi:hypothetical protein
VLLVAVGWATLAGRDAAPGTRPVAGTRPDAVIPEETESVAVAAELSPRATVTTGPEAIAVPIESPYPDITIVRLYPTYRPEAAAEEERVILPSANNVHRPDAFLGVSL